MFPVTITITTQAQLSAVMNALFSAPTEPVAVAADTKVKPVVAKLTKTQTDAMDDTAGLESKPGKSSAATAPTSPTAEAVAVAAQEKTADASAQSAASAEVEHQASTAATDKPITYAELQGAVLKLHKADATAAKPIAEAMGFANFKAMPEDKWPEALRRVQAELDKRGV